MSGEPRDDQEASEPRPEQQQPTGTNGATPPLNEELPPNENEAGADEDPVRQLVAEFNNEYAVVNEAGRTLVFQRTYDPTLRRKHFVRLTFDDFRRLYLNRYVQTGKDDKGAPIFKSVAEVWLRHSRRRQYINGVTFDPSGTQRPNILNLWRGFAVDRRFGSWSKMMYHLLSTVCSGDEDRFDYLLDWSARLLQRPAEQGEVALVLKGGEGVGKGIFARALCYILGQHGMQITHSKQLTGNFNGHLRDCVYLFADEAFYAGDRAHVSVLKALITEPYITIEGKYQNAVQASNYLHIIMASNEDWVIPASIDSRRFFVLIVPNTHVGDATYFAAIQREMETGGYQAMLDELLGRDISGFDPRNPPVTEGLIEQRKLSLDTSTAWWLDVLHRGYVFQSKLGLENYFIQWHDAVTTEILFASYTAFAERRRERHPLSRETFGRFMTTKAGARPCRPTEPIGEHITDVDNPYGGKSRVAKLIMKDRPHGYRLGALDAARAEFIERTKLTVDWQDQDEEP